MDDHPVTRPPNLDELARTFSAAVDGFIVAVGALADAAIAVCDGTFDALAAAITASDDDEHPEPQCVCGLPRHHAGDCADDAAHASPNGTATVWTADGPTIVEL